MNKRIILSLLIFTFGMLLVGCNPNNEDIKWEIDNINKIDIPDNALEVFNRANTNNTYEVIALLGKQVVAGTNYMYLCKDGNDYKVVIVYNNLDNQSTITTATDFDVTRYINQSTKNTNTNLAGGWYVEAINTNNVLDTKVKELFDNATQSINDITYTPIGVLAHQNNSYAILCYGEHNNNTGIYVLTINDKELTSAYVNLGDYNL